MRSKACQDGEPGGFLEQLNRTSCVQVTPLPQSFVSVNLPSLPTPILQRFTNESFEHLKTTLRGKPQRERLCSVMMDEMSIRKKSDLDIKSGRLTGHVDFGRSQSPLETDNAPLAGDALVLMAVGLVAAWKIPASLCKDTFGEQRQKMLSLSSRLMSLRLPAGRLVAQDGRRMSIISLAFTLKSVADLAKRLFEGDKYIGTYRLSQDHLELFFSCVRQRGGWNNNPSAAQFRYAYRSLLVNADVQAPATANVTPDMEEISTLRHQGTMRTTEEDEEPQSSNPLELVIPDHDYGVSVNQ
ncbi:hypothetical protein HPB47_026710 [Ixodes persulcatus]|uniref:Uncharacterized protein n=1 Tax=Ixodes persulcatus TaxID=34615 RepID=A0AC60PYJ3_IXOPE|nr:hypothetical protein HPB47_026710 [Ixodes persulcatus]